MYDDEQLGPTEPDENIGRNDRQRVPKWIWFAMGLLTIVLIAIVLVVTVAYKDRGRQVASDVKTGVDEGLAEPLAAEPLQTEPESGAPGSSGSGGQETQPPMEGDASEPDQLAETPTTEAAAEPTVVPTEEPSGVPTATEPVTPEARPDPINGRIAVVDNSARLWTMTSDGSDRRLLSGQGRFYQFPSWSPAGNEIAVIGNDFEGGGVYVVADEEDTEIVQLYADSNFQPIYLYWSPDGENVSFIASHPDGLALHMAAGDGRLAPQLVATSPGTFFWDWMPDGSQVLVHTGFTARSSDNSRLAFVPVGDSGEPEEIIQQGFFQAPAVASDGRYFSYGDEDSSGNRYLRIHDINGDQQVELVSHQGVVAMGFSPTGPQLAFTSPNRPAQSFYGALRLIDLENGRPRLLVPDPVLAFFWSPDGRSIAYLTLSVMDRPFDFDDAPVAGLVDWPVKKNALGKALPPSQDDHPRFGLALSIVGVDSGESRLLTVFEPGTLFLDQFLPFFDQYAHSHRLWSPDSRALALPMKDERDRDIIVLVPVDGSEPQPIAQGVAAFWSHQ